MGCVQVNTENFLPGCPVDSADERSETGQAADVRSRITAAHNRQSVACAADKQWLKLNAGCQEVDQSSRTVTIQACFQSHDAGVLMTGGFWGLNVSRNIGKKTARRRTNVENQDKGT